jgi:hypothetical protein
MMVFTYDISDIFFAVILAICAVWIGGAIAVSKIKEWWNRK